MFLDWKSVVLESLFNEKVISWKLVYDISLKSEGLTCIHMLKYTQVSLTQFPEITLDLAEEKIAIMNKLRVVSSIRFDGIVNGNTLENKEDTNAQTDGEPLPKRRKHAKCSSTETPAATTPVSPEKTEIENVLQMIIESPDSKLPSVSGTRIIKAAKQLLWSANKSQLGLFQEKLEEASLFVSSSEYNTFLASVNRTVGITSYPAISSFEVTLECSHLIGKKQTLAEISATASTVKSSPSLSFDKQNALWYVGGYVIGKKEMDMRLPLKDELLEDHKEDNGDKESEDEEGNNI
uniref:Uncharacterized protein n=1 Tax=Amphimedon queenslandica TaxID=400682 RepID=A0A1X7VSQ2_AMPQE